MTNIRTLQNKADASRKKYEELLRLQASGVMFGARILTRAHKTWKIRQASADGRGLSM